MDDRETIHTMNNHLMVILGNLELLNAEVSDPSLQVSISDALSATEKAIDLVEALRANGTDG